MGREAVLCLEEEGEALGEERVAFGGRICPQLAPVALTSCQEGKLARLCRRPP